MVSLILFTSQVFAKEEPDWGTKICDTKSDRACYSLPSIPDTESKLSDGRVVFSFSDTGCLASSPIYIKNNNKFQKNSGIENSTLIFKNYKSVCQFRDQLEHPYITYNEMEQLEEADGAHKGYKARIFGLYTVHDVGHFGHNHDWEHAILWMKDDQPIYLSISRHNGTKYREISNAPRLAENKNIFAVKYIFSLGTHSLGFSASDHNNIVTNSYPTPSKRWFGLANNELVDIRTYPGFKDFLSRQDYEHAVSRVDDRYWVQCARPPELINKNINFSDKDKTTPCTMKNENDE